MIGRSDLQHVIRNGSLKMAACLRQMERILEEMDRAVEAFRKENRGKDEEPVLADLRDHLNFLVSRGVLTDQDRAAILVVSERAIRRVLSGGEDRT